MIEHSALSRTFIPLLRLGDCHRRGDKINVKSQKIRRKDTIHYGYGATSVVLTSQGLWLPA